MARTDIHRPSAPEFDPQAYEFVGAYDFDDEFDNKSRQKQVSLLVSEGYKFAIASQGGCGHCGAHIRYGALMTHPSTKEMLYVGEQCLANRFESLTATQFKKLRENAKLNKDRATKKEKRDAFIANSPEVQALVAYDEEHQAGDGSAPFLFSLAEQLQRNGFLSEKQVASIIPAIEKEQKRDAQLAERKADKESLIKQGVLAPTGKVTVEGEVVALTYKDTEFGTVYKMIVKSDEGWAVYVTQPEALSSVARGDRVRFTATLTQSPTDQLFAFGKRPTQASIVSACTTGASV